MAEVSVVIPVYNGEEYIEQSINSVLNQTYPAKEIVVVNDASTDRTEELIKTKFGGLIKEGKLIYLKNEKNAGRNISGNRGAQVSSGEYLFFLDADDLWRENHIEKVLGVFEESSPDVVYTRPRTFIDEKGRIKRTSKSEIPQDLGYVVFSSKIGFPSATAFRRESFPFYNPEYRFREDIELFIRAFLEGRKIIIADTDTVLIREHSAPGRMSKSSNFYKYTLKLYRDYLDKVPEGYKGFFIFHVGETALRFGDFKTGYGLIFKLLREYPQVLKDKKVLLSLLKRGVRFDRLFKA